MVIQILPMWALWTWYIFNFVIIDAKDYRRVEPEEEGGGSDVETEETGYQKTYPAGEDTDDQWMESSGNIWRSPSSKARP